MTHLKSDKFSSVGSPKSYLIPPIYGIELKSVAPGVVKGFGTTEPESVFVYLDLDAAFYVDPLDLVSHELEQFQLTISEFVIDVIHYHYGQDLMAFQIDVDNVVDLSMIVILLFRQSRHVSLLFQRIPISLELRNRWVKKDGQNQQ